MRVLIAPNAFKGALSAHEAAKAIRTGLERSGLKAEYDVVPIADGGDGTLPIMREHLDAEIRIKEVSRTYSGKIDASWAYSPDGIAAIELAEANGLKHENRLHLRPWYGNTHGTGELILEAIKKGCKHIYLSIGGSATVDGGFGILKALGAKFNSQGEIFDPVGPKDFKAMDGINMDAAKAQTQGVKLTLLSDVVNRISGAEGAVRVFGSQKGIQKREMQAFEDAIDHWVQLMQAHSNTDLKSLDSGGASGGVIIGLSGVFEDMEVLSGADAIMHMRGIPYLVSHADLMITGEGMIDMQTGYGKAPAEIAKLSKAEAKPCFALCGQLSTDYDPENSLFTAVFSINPRLTEVSEAITATYNNLAATAFNLGRVLASQGSEK